PTGHDQRQLFHELLLDAVLHLDREARKRSDFLLVEDAAEFAHRIEEPLRLVRHAADVTGPDAEFLDDLLLRPLGDPVVEKGGRLDFGEEEVVVLDRESQIRFLDLLLDPRVVAATEVELRHVRRRADGPEVEEAIVAGFPESVTHLDSTERIDVQVACPLPEECGFEGAIMPVEELLYCEKIKDIGECASDGVD